MHPARTNPAIAHPSDEAIESYVRGHLGHPDSAMVVRIERHVLGCPWCVLRAEHAVELGQAIRDALSTLKECYSA